MKETWSCDRGNVTISLINVLKGINGDVNNWNLLIVYHWRCLYSRSLANKCVTSICHSLLIVINSIFLKHFENLWRI